MRSTIKKLVTPPTFADETQSRLVSWLHTYLILAIITVLILLPAILDSSERLSTSLMISTAWLVTHFLSWVLLRHRLVQLSKYLIISSFFIISVVTLFLYNGLRSFSIVSFFIFLAVISFLTNARTLIFFAALSIAVFSVAFYAEQIGIIQPVFIPMIAPITLALLLGALTAHTLILRFIVHAHQAQEENNRHITNELIVRNHALEASQSLLQKAHDELEKRVADRTFQLSWTNEQLSHEIKDRQLAVDMLLKSEATWRSLVTHAPNTILTIDTAFKILFTNQVTELMQKKHPVGNSVFDIQLQSDCFPLMRQCFQDVIETGELGAFEATGVGALNGRLFMCRVGPILQNDQIESLILIFTDITERKQAEEMVLYSTKMESLGVLAGGVAHDFNNLLVAMLGQSSLALVKLEEESKARTHVEKVMKAAERAAHLTKQMLAYSGKSQFSKKIFNVNDLIQENIELFQAAISKNVRLRPSLHTNLPLIEADINQMQQVIMNLILNAAEAIEHTLGTVNIRTSIDQILGYEKEYWQWTGKPLAPGRYLCIEIRDNGKGMDANTLSKIFDPFFTTKFTGRGLGLAAVIGIIRGHRGGIKVFSTVNEGTTFRLLFPILPHSEIAVVAKDDKVVETAVFQLTNATILVIDDEETILETVSDMLFEIGYQVIIANSGESGLSSYQEKMNQIGIVLLDLSMPGLSGRETFNALRRLNPDVNIILSSGYSQQEVKERYFQNDDEFDYTQFLSKPYEPDTLVNLIHNSLTQDENR